MQTHLPSELAARLKKDENGLFAAIAQQWDTREVLMLAWMNEESLALTLKESRAVYWSRSRQELWRKGDTSGHYQFVRDVLLDCDGDAILLLVDQVGAACHTGTRTCFHSIMESDQVTFLMDDGHEGRGHDSPG
jgi:phosphoribosyl-AMP cyclohydrolase